MVKQLIVDRFHSDDNSTISLISVDGDFICFGLENGYKENKVYGKTRIPSGRYKLKVRTFGGFHQRYSKRFPSIHKGMVEIVGVPNFTDILIHIGNTHEDTEGCLLTGTGVRTNPSINISNSQEAYLKLYGLIIDDVIDGNVELVIADGDL